MADYPFYDKQPGPERREKLNELYATWEAAMGNVVKGDKGWSPLIRAVADAERVVLQLYDWTGGQGVKPTQTGYIGATGYVSDISLAIDFRGPIGTQGNPGPANTLSIGTVSSGTNASATITGASPSQVLSLVLPKGDTGDTGAAATISVGSVITGGAGTSASVDNSGTSSAAILNFTIPRGDKGEQGIQGVQGLQGVAGDAATIAVGTVTTGAAGTQVQVVNVGSPSAAVFDFTIPKGQDGTGAGDMLKVDYDSIGDGVVNAAREVPWGGITDKPIVIASGATQEDARSSIGAVAASDVSALNATKANVLEGTDGLYVSGGTYLNVISWNNMGSLSSNTSINLNTSLNHNLAATASLTLDATNVNPGKTGDIVITTPSAVTVSWAAKWKFLGSVPNIGGAGETWVVSYKVFDANTIYASAVKVA